MTLPSLHKENMIRCYDTLIEDHLSSNKQMIFLSGPRQVGKTTTAKNALKEGLYLNWDNPLDQRLFFEGVEAVVKKLKLDSPAESIHRVVFDELHRNSKWKNFLKGFYDMYAEQCKIIVTGSARLDVFRKGSDSLMGRYFHYRMHPFSVAELSSSKVNIETDIQEPAKVSQDLMQQLEVFGGFPDPFLSGNKRFYNRWKKLRNELLFKEDLRDLSLVNDVSRIQMLAEMIAAQSGQLTNYSTFSKQLNVTVDTIKNWFRLLESLYYSFRIRPWYSNISNSLRKQPKTYLWDWSSINDAGARRENFVASHLLKAVHWWTDCGLGEYELFFIRDKQKREVDFLVVRNQEPWFLVEVKSSSNSDLSPSLKIFSQQLGIEYAFQVVFDLPYAELDCFSYKQPVKIPVSTLLARLI